MSLHHELGQDAPDPRLAFLVGGERGLTRGAIQTRLRIGLGMAHDAAEAFVSLAIEVGFLRPAGDGLFYPLGRTASGLLFDEPRKAH